MSYRAKTRCWLIAMALAMLCPLLLIGQEAAQGGQSKPNPTVSHPLQVNVTGCLRKDSRSISYYVVDQNGRRWQLTGTKFDFSKQLNHVVNVSGRPSSSSKSQPENNALDAASDNPEANLTFDLDVTDLRMVSPSCTR